MILVIDIGNTTIAFTGIDVCCKDADPDDNSLQAAAEESFSADGIRDLSVLFEAKLPTGTGRDLPRFLQESKALLGRFGITYLSEQNAEDKDKVEVVAISSVVPADTPAAIQLAEKICAVPPVLISCKSDSGLSFERLPVPEKVGTDRIADAAWAAARYPLPAMTADLGTATTINVIAPVCEKTQEADRAVCPEQTGDTCGSGNDPADKTMDLLSPGLRGIFLGGMIGAGVRTSLRALRTGTAQLPDLEPRPVAPENLIGINTDGCMLSSAVVGTAAQIEGLALRVEEQLGMPVTLILTGGNAPVVSPWIRRPFIYEPSLASKGAAVTALRELSGKKRAVQEKKAVQEE